MKFRFAFFAFSLLNVLTLVGCNGVGDKDSILARVNKEKVYREDVTMLLRNSPSEKADLSQFLYDNLFAKAAVVSAASVEYPELLKDWDEYYKELEPRLLTMVYQNFYTMECLGYSDGELRQFYEANLGMFPEGSEYMGVRGAVATELYLSKNKEAFDKYIQDNRGASDTAKVDTSVMKTRFVEDYRQALRDKAMKEVVAKQRIDVRDVAAADSRAYYEKHLDEFKTTEGYELYHIQSKDSAALSQMVGADVSVEQFKILAQKNSQNKATARDSGLVGVVKRGFALPYGIGMVEKLDASLEGKEPGFVTGVLLSRTPVDTNYHRFYLAKVVPSQQKSFERVKDGIAKDIAAGAIFEVDSNEVVVTQDGKAVVSAGDLLRFNAKYGKPQMTKHQFSRLAAMFAELCAFSSEAKDLKLNHGWEFRSLIRLSRLSYITDRYLDNLNDKSISEDSLKALYERFGNPANPGASFENSINDMRTVALFPKNLYTREYFYGYRVKYGRLSVEKSFPDIYKKRIDEYLKMLKKKTVAEIYAKASVRLYDANFEEFKPRLSEQEVLADADSMANAGDRDGAFLKYRQLLYLYPENDSLFQKALYEMAQIQNDKEEFYDAESEYYALYTMWPEGPYAEKSMFSRGFILNENLKMNEAALKVFEEFLTKFPNSELKESVDWLVQNIKSNGKLADDLMKKISAEE